MPLPEYAINEILRKFGPEIVKYLNSVGFFETEGPYEPLDLWTGSELKRYVAASNAKNKKVWEAVEATMFPEMGLCSEAFAEAYNLKPVWNVADIATAYFKPHSGELIKDMTKTDKNGLMRFIWANSGKNERPLARQILEEPNLSSIVDLTGARARTITRTERHRMTWGSSLQFAQEAGSKTKEWLTVGDARVRNSHRAMSGEIVGIREAFSNGLDYPSEPNCRCHLVYGFEKGLRRTGIQAFTKTPPPYTGLSDEQIEALYA